MKAEKTKSGERTAKSEKTEIRSQNLGVRKIEINCHCEYAARRIRQLA